jgi:hypothetical protein
MVTLEKNVASATSRWTWTACTIRHRCTSSLWLFATLVAILTTNQWFVPGRMIGGGDLFPIITLNPSVWAPRIRYAWDMTGAMGGPSPTLVYLFPFLGSQLLSTWLAPDQVQHVVFAVLFGAQFLAMAFFVHTILPGHRLAAFFAGLFYWFNPSSVLGAPGLFTMYMGAYVPYMAALFIHTAISPRRRVLTPLFVLSIAASGFISINPPGFVLFVVFNVFIAVYIVWRYRGSCDRVWRRVIMLGVLAVVMNLYWATTLYYSLFGSKQTVISAVTNVLNLSFVYQRDSILNLFQLNPIWGWRYTDIYPYAPAYSTPLLLAVVFVPALLAFSALLNGRIPRHIVLPATTIALVLLLICTALHGPWQSINLFLFQHVPFFWLFRQPDTKFLGYIVMVYAVLIGYQAEWLTAWIAHLVWRRPWMARSARVGTVALLGSLFVIAAFPIVTGQVAGAATDHRRSTIITNRMAVPAYWFELARFLSQHDPQARILVLPNDDFYAMPYRWGFYGSDLLVTELLPNPAVILSNASLGYTSNTSTYNQLTGELLTDLSRARHVSLIPLLAAQGITYVLQRNDIDTSSPTRHILPARQVTSFLHGQQGIHRVRSFGLLDLYVVDRRHYVPPVYTVPLSRAAIARFGPQRTASQTVMAALGFSSAGVFRPGNRAPHVTQVRWAQENPARWSVRIGPTAGPLVLVLSALYHPYWHACLVPAGAPVWPWTCWFNGFMPASTHVRPGGFANGWLIDRAGRYTLILDYGFQHVADLFQFLAACTLGGAIVWGALPYLRRVRRRRHDDASVVRSSRG